MPVGLGHDILHIEPLAFQAKSLASAPPEGGCTVARSRMKRPGQWQPVKWNPAG
jgi:hypothetical protein